MVSRPKKSIQPVRHLYGRFMWFIGFSSVVLDLHGLVWWFVSPCGGWFSWLPFSQGGTSVGSGYHPWTNQRWIVASWVLASAPNLDLNFNHHKISSNHDQPSATISNQQTITYHFWWGMVWCFSSGLWSKIVIKSSDVWWFLKTSWRNHLSSCSSSRSKNIQGPRL